MLCPGESSTCKNCPMYVLIVFTSCSSLLKDYWVPTSANKLFIYKLNPGGSWTRMRSIGPQRWQSRGSTPQSSRLCGVPCAVCSIYNKRFFNHGGQGKSLTNSLGNHSTRMRSTRLQRWQSPGSNTTILTTLRGWCAPICTIVYRTRNLLFMADTVSPGK
jgi:hypothetical protein